MGMIPMGRSSDGEDPLKADKFDKDKVVTVSDFKLGKKEKVGDKEAQAVEYQVGLGGKKFPATVWIDLKTNLPLSASFRSPSATRRPL